MGESKTEDGWTVEQLDDKKFIITDNETGRTYTIESDLIPDGIVIGGESEHFYVEEDG